MRRHSMLHLLATDVKRWLSTVDCVHVSVDVDSVYHEALAVSTPVPGGLPVPTLLNVLRLVRDSGKLLCADVVEFNPTVGDAAFTADLVDSMIRALEIP
jgi:arginase family enzyme